ncbi:MAG: tail fiber domain-containing protein [Actinomycetota bacterium]
MQSPGSITNAVPDPDKAIRLQRDVQRQMMENASARSLQQSQIGAGGLLVNGGGSITVTGGGSITLPTGTLSAGNVTATSAVTAGGAITGASVAVTGAATAATVTSTGDVNAAGTLNGPAGVNSLGAYSNLLTSGYRALWVTTTGSTGAFGYVPSSRRFKQEEKPATVDLSAALAIQVVTFRYTQAVEELGDEAQVEWGVIAEDLHALGFTWLVDYDEDEQPFGVKKEALIFAFIPVIQDHEARLTKGGL